MSRIGITNCFGTNDYGKIDVPDEFKNTHAIIAAAVQHTCMADQNSTQCFGRNN